MSAAKIPKTNAARLLESKNIAFELHMAEVDEDDLSAVTMAHKLGGGDTCATILRYNAGHAAKRMNP